METGLLPGTVVNAAGARQQVCTCTPLTMVYAKTLTHDDTSCQVSNGQRRRASAVDCREEGVVEERSLQGQCCQLVPEPAE